MKKIFIEFGSRRIEWNGIIMKFSSDFLFTLQHLKRSFRILEIWIGASKVLFQTFPFSPKKFFLSFLFFASFNQMTFLMRNFPIQSPKHIPKLSSFCCMLVVKLKEKMENVA
jgi:hypothetical protein